MGISSISCLYHRKCKMRAEVTAMTLSSHPTPPGIYPCKIWVVGNKSAFERKTQSTDTKNWPLPGGEELYLKVPNAILQYPWVLSSALPSFIWKFPVFSFYIFFWQNVTGVSLCAASSWELSLCETIHRSRNLVLVTKKTNECPWCFRKCSN